MLALGRIEGKDGAGRTITKKLKAKSKQASDAMALLDEATTYVQLVKRFRSRANWQAFAGAFGTGRHSTTSRGLRILKRLITNGTE